MIKFFASFMLSLAVLSGYASAAIISEEHRGVLLAAKPLPGEKLDITPASPAAAIKAMASAVDQVYAKSSFAADKINQLKKNGRIQIVYDAEFPKLNLLDLTIAAFFPDFFQHGTKNKDFVVVVGRYGAKWTPDELAAVIVHELVGHGLQHLRRHTSFMRNLDLECEAYLYQEQYYQAAKFDRTTRDQAGFRDALTNQWCSDFIRYMRKHAPDKMIWWGPAPIQVPKLLKIFAQYAQHLKKTGVAGKAIKTDRAKLANNFKALEAEAGRSGDPEKLFQLGFRYYRGIGVEKNKRTGLDWIYKAANHGHAKAQAIIGRAFERGDYERKDPVEAYKWYVLASKGGERRVAKDIEQLAAKLSVKQRQEAERQARTFKPGK